MAKIITTLATFGIFVGSLSYGILGGYVGKITPLLPLATPTATVIPTQTALPTATPTLTPTPTATFIPTPIPQPPDDHPVHPGKWIEVDLSQQILWAWQDDTVVFSTLVSTGLPKTPTPIGQFQIFWKLRYDDMEGGQASGDYYFVKDVPYVMYFYQGGYALHGVYWHSNFGRPMSHGCVGLPVAAASWLFYWTQPATSPGHDSAWATAEGPGTMIIIHQ